MVPCCLYKHICELINGRNLVGLGFHPALENWYCGKIKTVCIWPPRRVVCGVCSSRCSVCILVWKQKEQWTSVRESGAFGATAQNSESHPWGLYNWRAVARILFSHFVGFWTRKTQKMNAEQWDAQFDTNLTGLYKGFKAVRLSSIIKKPSNGNP